MKRTLLSVSGIAAGLLLLASGCKKVDSNDLKDTVPYYQEYTVSYNKAAATTQATALIRVREKNGSRVELTNGAYIHANGVDENDKQPASNTYNWFFTGIKDIRFDLAKNSGNVITNIVSTTGIGNIDFATSMPNSFAKGTEFTFEWTGDDLATDEELSATITGKSVQSALVPWTQALTINGRQITVSADAVANIMTGDVTIKLQRVKSKALDAADGEAGGSIKITATTNRVFSMN